MRDVQGHGAPASLACVALCLLALLRGGGGGAGMSGDLTVSPNSFGVHRRNSTDSYVGFAVPLARVEDLTSSTHNFVFPSARGGRTI